MMIADTGQGMDDEKLAALFHKMGKDISTRGTNSEVGTGLGLIMVKKFVDENKGSLSVTSTPGKGTTFTIELPAAAV
jgi:signal transduction histidine kinase